MRRAYGSAPGPENALLTPADRAWGLMPRGEYADVLARTVERDWIRRFEAFGFDAAKAWNASAQPEERINAETPIPPPA